MKIYDEKDQIVGRQVSVNELKSLDAVELNQAFTRSDCAFLCRENGEYFVLTDVKSRKNYYLA